MVETDGETDLESDHKAPGPDSAWESSSSLDKPAVAVKDRTKGEEVEVCLKSL